mmetsp:Transcript_25968/g.60620  ORF Transcript_25968/g.60620 Transcript_25968/m.60620 type:complete len:512 (+) Transcript_25968:596-2131(+)
MPRPVAMPVVEAVRPVVDWAISGEGSVAALVDSTVPVPPVDLPSLLVVEGTDAIAVVFASAGGAAVAAAAAGLAARPNEEEKRPPAKVELSADAADEAAAAAVEVSPPVAAAATGSSSPTTEPAEALVPPPPPPPPWPPRPNKMSTREYIMTLTWAVLMMSCASRLANIDMRARSGTYSNTGSVTSMGTGGWSTLLVVVFSVFVFSFFLVGEEAVAVVLSSFSGPALDALDSSAAVAASAAESSTATAAGGAASGVDSAGTASFIVAASFTAAVAVLVSLVLLAAVPSATASTNVSVPSATSTSTAGGATAVCSIGSIGPFPAESNTDADSSLSLVPPGSSDAKSICTPTSSADALCACTAACSACSCRCPSSSAISSARARSVISSNLLLIPSYSSTLPLLSSFHPSNSPRYTVSFASWTQKASPSCWRRSTSAAATARDSASARRVAASWFCRAAVWDAAARWREREADASTSVSRSVSADDTSERIWRWVAVVVRRVEMEVALAVVAC